MSASTPSSSISPRRRTHPLAGRDVRRVHQSSAHVRLERLCAVAGHRDPTVGADDGSVVLDWARTAALVWTPLTTAVEKMTMGAGEEDDDGTLPRRWQGR